MSCMTGNMPDPSNCKSNFYDSDCYWPGHKCGFGAKQYLLLSFLDFSHHERLFFIKRQKCRTPVVLLTHERDVWKSPIHDMNLHTRHRCMLKSSRLGTCWSVTNWVETNQHRPLVIPPSMYSKIWSFVCNIRIFVCRILVLVDESSCCVRWGWFLPCICDSKCIHESNTSTQLWVRWAILCPASMDNRCEPLRAPAGLLARRPTQAIRSRTRAKTIETRFSRRPPAAWAVVRTCVQSFEVQASVVVVGGGDGDDPEGKLEGPPKLTFWFGSKINPNRKGNQKRGCSMVSGDSNSTSIGSWDVTKRMFSKSKAVFSRSQVWEERRNAGKSSTRNTKVLHHWVAQMRCGPQPMGLVSHWNKTWGWKKNPFWHTCWLLGVGLTHVHPSSFLRRLTKFWWKWCRHPTTNWGHLLVTSKWWIEGRHTFKCCLHVPRSGFCKADSGQHDSKFLDPKHWIDRLCASFLFVLLFFQMIYAREFSIGFYLKMTCLHTRWTSRPTWLTQAYPVTKRSLQICLVETYRNSYKRVWSPCRLLTNRSGIDLEPHCLTGGYTPYRSSILCPCVVFTSWTQGERKAEHVANQLIHGTCRTLHLLVFLLKQIVLLHESLHSASCPLPRLRVFRRVH